MTRFRKSFSNGSSCRRARQRQKRKQKSKPQRLHFPVERSRGPTLNRRPVLHEESSLFWQSSALRFCFQALQFRAVQFVEFLEGGLGFPGTAKLRIGTAKQQEGLLHPWSRVQRGFQFWDRCCELVILKECFTEGKSAFRRIRS